MWISVVSVGIAFVAAIGITWGVTTATRRSDRRRRARGEKLPNEGGALVTVRLRRWQWLVIRVLAVVLLVVGGLLDVVVIGLAPEGAPPSMVVVAMVFVLAGAGGIVLASSMRRTRILAMEDHLLVRQGLREERRVDLREIATLAPLANQYGGVQGRSADGRRLFHVMGLARGYVEFDAYLRERVVHNSAPAPAAFAADTVPVPPWRGVSASADWTNIPLGHGGRPRPVIRLFVDGDVVVLHTSDVRALVDGRQAVAESDSQPLAFLASPALVDPTSLGGRQVAGLPPESLVLLRDAQEVPTAVLRDGDARSFRRWVSGLPR